MSKKIRVSSNEAEGPDPSEGPLDRGPFFYWSENGTGPSVWLGVLKKYYTELAGDYMAKGMVEEARLFNELVQDFNKMEQKIAELAKRTERVEL